MTKTSCLSTVIFRRIFFLFHSHFLNFVSQSHPIRRAFLRHLVSIADSAQCNRKSAICGLQIRSGQRSAFVVLTKRKAGSGDEIAQTAAHIRTTFLSHCFCGLMKGPIMYQQIENDVSVRAKKDNGTSGRSFSC